MSGTETDPVVRELAGKVALVTGGASGIGSAIAQMFRTSGSEVAILDLNLEPDTSQSNLEIIGDVSREADCARAVSQTLDRLGGLDILVNAAGIIHRAAVTELSQSEWDAAMAVNLKSVYLLSKLAIPNMAARGGGVIVNIASGWGLRGGPSAAAYCASKGGVVQLTRAMAIDHGPSNIRVNCICPGDTDTPMMRHEAEQLGLPEREFLAQAARRPLGRIGHPRDIAEAALFLASDASSFVTGSVLVVDGGGLAGSA